MRWSNLSITPPAARPDALPLEVPDAVVRTFDTPGFAGMTFYEVHAKSVINRVPAASRVPFEWTINPYRGCTHACAYCLSGDTPILMADGRTTPLAELRPGDRIYGTVRRGRDRCYVATEVLAHWSTVKPAYRVVLADGTRLVASGDHRFLTHRGWKHVTGQPCGSGTRPHLTSSDALIGVGQLPPVPRFRLPPGDLEALRRTRRYRAEVGAAPAGGGSCQAPEDVTDAWSTGFLADGIASTSDADLRVVAVEPLGVELPLYDITTGTGDFIADGVVSHNCFARNTHTYLDLDAGEDFDRRIIVKVNAGELARRELAAPRWCGDHIAMGTNVDCY